MILLIFRIKALKTDSSFVSYDFNADGAGS
jgi:hypothetical protein